jgi:hypothetical protein
VVRLAFAAQAGGIDTRSARQFNRAGVEHPTVWWDKPGSADEVADARSLKDDRGVARSVDFERHFALAYEEEFVGRLALVKQIFAGMEDMVASAAGDEPNQFSGGVDEEGVLLQDLFKGRHAVVLSVAAGLP